MKFQNCQLQAKIYRRDFNKNSNLQQILKVPEKSFLKSSGALFPDIVVDMFPGIEVSSKGVHRKSKDLSTKLKNLSFKGRLRAHTPILGSLEKLRLMHNNNVLVFEILSY